MKGIPLWLRVVVLVAMLIAILAAITFVPAHGQPRQEPILTTGIKGAIGVAATLHVCGVIDEAGKTNAELVLLQIDTPGGLLSATRDLIQCILGSSRPVVVYVAPSGARAASAGTYIAQAAHVAAMAPGTHLGAATPVALGLPSPVSPQDRRPEDKDKQPQAPGAVDQKVINDAVAYLKGLAQLRGRNAEWAELAVREAATLTASDALKEKVVDVVAEDADDLLRQLDGRVVMLAGKETRLATSSAVRIAMEPDWRMQLLATISDPNVAFVLLLIGVYGILYEFWSPGAIVPGVVGGISLLLALTALSVLPLSYGALALVLLGIALMIAEAFVPGVGILGIGGLTAFVIGAIFLFDPRGADFDLRIAWPVIIGTAATTVLLSAGVLASVIQVRRRKPVTGAEEMIGLVGDIVTWHDRSGSIHVHGEVWIAKGDCTLKPGDPARVVRRDGLTLVVEPATAA
ncbi:MAG: nodulation protein NfeD [Pseudomonadota bacterium]